MKSAVRSQRREITIYYVYKNLAKVTKNKYNSKILEDIAKDELNHYNILKSITKRDVKPNKFIIKCYKIICYVLGLSFGLKLMEKKEVLVKNDFKKVVKKFPKLKKLEDETISHEKVILSKLKEERVTYAGSIVLGLNDALVELTGALAGFTFALQNTKFVAVSGIITGFAASLSMAASGYLSSKEDSTDKVPIKSAIYTGVAYIITVLFLVSPYLFFSNVFVALGSTFGIALIIISFYTFYITTAKSQKFLPRFFEMAFLSIIVATISFCVGLLLRNFVGIDI